PKKVAILMTFFSLVRSRGVWCCDPCPGRRSGRARASFVGLRIGGGRMKSAGGSVRLRYEARAAALPFRSMLLTRFVPCVRCSRWVRVFDSRLRQAPSSEVQLPEDGATSAKDGTFECPFCGRVQRPE